MIQYDIAAASAFYPYRDAIAPFHGLRHAAGQRPSILSIFAQSRANIPPCASATVTSEPSRMQQRSALNLAG